MDTTEKDRNIKIEDVHNRNHEAAYASEDGAFNDDRMTWQAFLAIVVSSHQATISIALQAKRV